VMMVMIAIMLCVAMAKLSKQDHLPSW